MKRCESARMHSRRTGKSLEASHKFLAELYKAGKATREVRKEWDSMSLRGREFGGSVVMRRKRAYYSYEEV